MRVKEGNVMIFVVKTRRQLVEAIRGNAQEIIIMGRQAAEIIKAIHQPPKVENTKSLYSIFARLKHKFEVLELTDNSQQVEGILYRK
jgi:hypothetical protein